MRPFNNLKSMIPWVTYWKDQGVYMKNQANKLTDAPLEYYQDKMAFSELLMTSLTSIVASPIYCFRVVPEGKVDKEISESWRIEFLEKCLARPQMKITENNISGPRNRGGVADLSLLRILLKSWPQHK